MTEPLLGDGEVAARLRSLSTDRQRLAELLLARGRSVDGVPRRAAPGAVPLAPSQRRLWLFDQANPGNPSYNVAQGVRIVGQLDLAALRRALDEVVRRHDALRMCFRELDGQPVQEETSTPLDFEVVACDSPVSLQDLVREASRQPFDLSTGPLLRARLYGVGPGEQLLVVVVHHIAVDLWSFGVLLGELAQLYAGHAAGEPISLPAVDVRFCDVASWQHERLGPDRLAAGLDHWRQVLAGLPVLQLPTDRLRPPRPSFQGRKVRRALDTGLSTAVRETCRRERVTLFELLLAAFGHVLHRCTGQDDIAIGTPLAGRDHPDLAQVVGFLVNTVVLRLHHQPGGTFREALSNARQVVLDAQEHQAVPFEKVVEAVQPERDPSRNPLFQVELAVQNVPLGTVAVPGATLEFVDSDPGTSRFDLHIQAIESAERIHFDIEYATDLFDASTIDRMFGWFETVLRAVSSDPGVALSRLSLCRDDELRRQVVDWNDTDAPAEERGLHHLFLEQAAARPQAVAVTAGDRQVSYAELAGRATAFTSWLRSRDVGPGTLVVLFLDRSVDMVAALLGVLQSGAAYVPVDPDLPAERVELILADVDPAALVTQRHLLERLPSGPAAVLVVEDIEEAEPGEPGEPGTCEPDAALPPVSGDDLAYVIYTSGSTGKPKGVMVPHRGVVNFVRWMCEELSLDGDDVVLQRAPYSFDAAVREIYGALCSGARLVLARPGALYADYLVDLASSEGVTTVHLVPSLLRSLLDADLLACCALRQIVCGGEPLSPELVADVIEKGGARIVNVYGPTETSVDSTWWSSQDEVGWARNERVPIGRPIANTRVYVLDPGGRPQAVGVPGELHIGGAGVARGYLNHPELTAERFVADPFAGRPDARMYRTGDLARWRPDGNLDCLGRLDDQVKVRGYRIELGEVRAALAAHQAVRDCVVVAREDQPGERRLVAYVVAHDPLDPPVVIDLRDHLSASLPGYMVPACFVQLDDLPVTPNGKLDRRRLPVPEGDRPELRSAYEPPGTEAERALATIWSEVLGIHGVGVHDNFFELGGDSVLSVQVIARARAAGMALTPKQLYDHQTIALLATVASPLAAEAPGGDDGEEAEPAAPSFALANLSPGDLDRVLAQIRKQRTTDSDPDEVPRG